MRYALISDIHANLPALEAVLAHIDERSDVDAIYDPQLRRTTNIAAASIRIRTRKS